MNTSVGNLATDGLLIAYYADDFTGSTDALEWLCRAGLRTVLFIEPPTAEQLARYPGLRAIGVAGQTRSMSPAQMEATLRPAFGRLRELGARYVHYKVCSTFDSSPSVGSIGRALDVGAEVFESDFIPLLVGVPPLGRYCLFGNLFARMGIGSSGKIYRLDRHPSMSRHPVTPADESDLRLHLSRQTAQSVGLFDILQLSRPEPEARAALTDLLTAEQRIVLFDVLYAEQLQTIGRLIDARVQPGRPLFSVGSSGIEIALAAHWTSEGVVTAPTGWPELSEAKPLLVLSGSCSPVTEAQIAWAVREGFAEVGLSAAQMVGGGRDDHALALTVGHLKAGRSVVVHTSRGCIDPNITAAGREALGAALGEFGRAVLAQVAIRRLVIAGGDSSSHAARALGIEAVEMIAPLSPGAPLCRALAPGSPVDGLEVNFKGGQVGAENYFGALARGKL